MGEKTTEGPTIGIIQARLGSSRLPGKILAPLAARCLLDLLVARLAGSRVDQWWLATTNSREDDVTEAWGQALGLRVFRGAREDVLSRFTAIIEQTRAQWVVRMTADEPFGDGALGDRLLGARGADEKAASLFYFPRRPGKRVAGAPPSPPLGYGAQPAPTRAARRSPAAGEAERQGTRLNPRHLVIAHAVLCWKKKRRLLRQ